MNNQTILKPPQFIIGDTFVYQSYKNMENAKKGINAISKATNSVHEIHKNGNILFKTRNSVYSTLRDKSGNILVRYVNEVPYISYSPSWELCRYPIKKGDKRSVFFSHTPKMQSLHRYITERTAIVHVSGIQSITTPAGTFNAIKITMFGTYKIIPMGSNGVFKEQVWLGIETKMRPVLYSYKEEKGSKTIFSQYQSLVDIDLQ